MNPWTETAGERKTNVQRPLTSHDHAETGGCAETFLRGRNNNIDAPIVESDLFARNSADAVEDNLSARRLQLDTLRTIHRHHTRVSGDTRRVRSPMCFAFDRTPKYRTGVGKGLKEKVCGVPVLVSTWVNVTTLYFFPFKALQLVVSSGNRSQVKEGYRSSSDSVTAAPRGAFTWVTFAPYVSKLHGAATLSC